MQFAAAVFSRFVGNDNFCQGRFQQPLPLGFNQKLGVPVDNQAVRDIYILFPDRHYHLAQREFMGVQPHRVNLNRDLRVIAAKNFHIGNFGNPEKSFPDFIVSQLPDFGKIQVALFFRRQGQGENRGGRITDSKYFGRFDIRRQSCLNSF